MSTSPILDLSRRAFTRDRGILTVIGSWIMLEDGWKPCLVLIRAGEEHAETTQPCVVTQDKAFQWDPRTGHGLETLATVDHFIDALRLTPGKPARMLLLTLVNDYLDDLLRMHWAPPADAPREILGDITVTHRESGKVVREEALKGV